MNKRVLFINPKKNDDYTVPRIHMGFTLLGQILVSNGHTVKVMDYAFLKGLNLDPPAPEIETIIREFKPDVIGVSVFTYVYDESCIAIEEIANCSKAPIILGGPHFTFFPEEFKDDTRISYVVRGEGESVILNLVEKAKNEESPVFVDSPPASTEQIPAVNFDIVYGSEYCENYQIQLSRGCPYKCNFCVISSIAGRTMRNRDLKECLDQIIDAKTRYPNIKAITITDDCPNANKERFKTFLRMYAEKCYTRCGLTIDNVRANLLDEEMIHLVKAAGGNNICLGVESGHADVFNNINKGQTLDEVVRAAKLIKKHNLLLGLCFVIGLPGDNLKRHLHSIKLAKSLKPDYVFWNMCIPWPGSEVRRWFDTNGEVGEIRNFSTLIDDRVNFTTPPASSPDFPIDDRIKAWLMANMATFHISLRYPGSFSKLLWLTVKYSLYHQLFVFLVGISKHTLLKAMRRASVYTGLCCGSRRTPSA